MYYQTNGYLNFETFERAVEPHTRQKAYSVVLFRIWTDCRHLTILFAIFVAQFNHSEKSFLHHTKKSNLSEQFIRL